MKKKSLADEACNQAWVRSPLSECMVYTLLQLHQSEKNCTATRTQKLLEESDAAELQVLKNSRHKYNRMKKDFKTILLSKDPCNQTHHLCTHIHINR
jgi:hypothetical protein